MGKRVEETALNFYDNLILAAKRTTQRKEALSRADVELERLKHYLRLCHDLKIITIRQYEFASVRLVEIGRLLGGWLKKDEMS
jgi:hypothetical protein